MMAAKSLNIIITVLCYFSEMNLFSSTNKEAKAINYAATKYGGNLTAHEKFRKQEQQARTLYFFQITGVF